MPETESCKNLIALLQLAYSAEQAAAYAYRGHWHSVVDVDERARIKQIEDEEWHHRELVGGMLEKLGAHPSKQREIRSLLLGRALGFLCHLMGWLAPMYGAGRLESRNIREYETAARYARDSVSRAATLGMPTSRAFSASAIPIPVAIAMRTPA